MNRFWLTPPDVFEPLNQEFHFDFDPCPCPLPENYNSLLRPWGQMNFINPPFLRKDGVTGQGPTAFVRKAIAEQALGRTSVLLLPTAAYVNLLLEANAEARSMGRIRWLDADSRKPMPNPNTTTCFILRGR